MTQKNEFPPSSEDHLWAGLSFPVLELDEMAAGQAAVEDKVHFHRGVWWRRARPGFYQPCFPFQEVNPAESWPKRTNALAGFTHLTSAGVENASYRAIVRPNTFTYSIAQLSRDRRHSVRRGLANLEVRPIERLTDLLEDGFRVYASWRERAGWGRNKVARGSYAGWISRAFSRPKRIALGAYSGETLVAFMLPYAVCHVASPAFIASHTDYLKSCPNEALFHAFLSITRQTPGAQMADFGTVSAKPTLDRFKERFGELTDFPAYTWINPLVRPAARVWIRKRYPWLANFGNGAATVSTAASEA